jgi:hypothetical protein
MNGSLGMERRIRTKQLWDGFLRTNARSSPRLQLHPGQIVRLQKLRIRSALGGLSTNEVRPQWAACCMLLRTLWACNYDSNFPNTIRPAAVWSMLVTVILTS